MTTYQQISIELRIHCIQRKRNQEEPLQHTYPTGLGIVHKHLLSTNQLTTKIPCGNYNSDFKRLTEGILDISLFHIYVT